MKRVSVKSLSSWGTWLGLSAVALVSLTGCSDTNKNGQPDAVNVPAVEKTLDKAGDKAADIASKGSEVAKDMASAAVNTPEIQAAFAANASLKDATINVDTTDKDVTLSGTVKNAAQKNLAGQIAKQKAGGLKIINNLKVAGGAPSAAGKKKGS